MQGLMMDTPLLISGILTHAARHHGAQQVVSHAVEGDLRRHTFRDIERRCFQLARALMAMGLRPGERVGTLAWNTHRHLELYYGVTGIGAVCHTLNPRLFDDQLAYLVNHAEDRFLFIDLDLLPLAERLMDQWTGLEAVIVLTDAGHMPDSPLTGKGQLLCYEDLLAEQSDEPFPWPDLDENTAANLCYSSGTTGMPKGVLYSHRSTVLHALTCLPADVMGLRAVDGVLAAVPMFHVNCWALPYSVLMVGAKFILPGPHLDGAALHTLINDEGATLGVGVPTVWLGLLQHLRRSSGRLPGLERLIVGGAALPQSLAKAFAEDHGVRCEHAWGMTETSSLATHNAIKPAQKGLAGDALHAWNTGQDRVLFGVDMRILDADGQDLPWDGEAFGDLHVRGPGVCAGYFKRDDDDSHDVPGWMKTGDVARITEDGFMIITDRSKDVIKSGGEWISSIDLENIAMTHPAVREAAVIGVPHDKWDERPLLVCALVEGETPDKQDILAVFGGRCAKWWIPDDVVFVDELPHTATGKLSKLTLREQLVDYRLPGAD